MRAGPEAGVPRACCPRRQRACQKGPESTGEATEDKAAASNHPEHVRRAGQSRGGRARHGTEWACDGPAMGLRWAGDGARTASASRALSLRTCPALQPSLSSPSCHDLSPVSHSTSRIQPCATGAQAPAACLRVGAFITTSSPAASPPVTSSASPSARPRPPFAEVSTTILRAFARHALHRLMYPPVRPVLYHSL